MTKNIAISVKGVSKNFQLPHEKVDSVKSLFINPFRNNKGKTEVQHALKDISFEIPEGEFFGIVGRNGSGKSTLLKIIAGIYQPNKGKVTVNGRLIPFIELGVGFNPELTGRENVYLNGALMGFSKREIDIKLDAIVDFAELERFMDQKLKNYSSGMQVRLAFSVATVLAESDILLIDEVLAVGDADFQRKCFEYFKKLKRDKKTVIFVSHDMTAVREYCDKAVLIDNSKIIYSGTADEAAKEYTRLFLPDAYQAERKAEKLKKSEKDKSISKWGSGGVDMRNLQASKNIYDENDKTIVLSYDVVADIGFEDDIIPGFVIKDARGDSICGTNSDVLSRGRDKVHINKGGTIKATWTIPQVFNDGEYSVEPAILSGSTRETLQWWDEAISFRVSNDKSVPYPVALDIELTVK